MPDKEKRVGHRTEYQLHCIELDKRIAHYITYYNSYQNSIIPSLFVPKPNYQYSCIPPNLHLPEIFQWLHVTQGFAEDLIECPWRMVTNGQVLETRATFGNSD